MTQLKYFEAGNATHREASNDTIDALAADIRRHGVQKPLITRHTGDAYEVVCGLKRWKAAVVAGVAVVPVEVRTLTDAEAIALSVQDNLE